MGAYVDVAYDVGVDDGAVGGDVAAVAGAAGGVGEGHLSESLDEAGTVAVHGCHVGFVGCELVVDGDFASAGLVEDGDFDAVAEAAGAVDHDGVDVFDEAVVADVVVGYVVLDVFDAAVVADVDVVEEGSVDAAVFLHASGHVEVACEAADVADAGETYLAYVFEVGLGGDVYLAPVVAAATLAFEACDLLDIEAHSGSVVFGCSVSGVKVDKFCEIMWCCGVFFAFLFVFLLTYS